MSFLPADNALEADFAKRTFLVVDDFQGMRTIIRDILRNCGVSSKNIETVANGNEAVATLTASHFDVVLCDFNLGKGKNGQQVLEEAKVGHLIGPACAWIMVTAEHASAAVSGAAEYQPDAYLLKPITEAALSLRLTKIWAKKTAFADIDRAIHQGNLADAVACCDERLRTDKVNASDLLRTKCDLLLSSDPGRAKEAYESILSHRDVPWAKAGLARVLMQDGDYAGAQVVLDEALGCNSAYLEAHDLMAQTLRAMGNLEAASAALERAVRLSPNSVTRQKNLGEVALRLGKTDDAERAFRRSVTLGEHSILKTPDAYLGLAKACAANNSLDEAFGVLRQVDKTFSGESVRLQTMAVEGLVHHQAGNADKAKEIAGTLARQAASGPTDAKLTLDTARLLLSTGAREDAIKLLQGEVSNSPENAALLGEVKEIFAAAEMGHEGEQLVESSRKAALEQMNRGVLLMREGRYDEAIVAMRATREAMPRNTRVLFNLTHVIVTRLQQGSNGDRALIVEAHSSLAAAHAIAPGDARYQRLKASLDTLAAGSN